MARVTRKRPECDMLEQRSLLSGVHSHVAVHHHHAHAGAARAPAAVAVAQAVPGGPVTGGGLINTGPAPANSSTQALQQAAESNNLVMFISQLETLKGTNGTTQQTSASILNDARNLELAQWDLADKLGVVLPADIEGNDRAVAQQLARSSRNGGIDQTYTSDLVTAETTLLGQLQSLQTSTDTNIQSFLTNVLPVVQADLNAAKGTGTLTPVSSNPSSTTLGASDVSTLETSYSTNLAERFLGQFTDLITNSNGVRQYADKLINDHAQTAVKQGRYAAATGTYLPASAQGSDVSTALKVVGAVNTRGRSTKYDRVYLQAMVRSHSADIQTNQNVVATIQNPVLKEFAMEDIPTDYLHRQGAQTLLRSNRR